MTMIVGGAILLDAGIDTALAVTVADATVPAVAAVVPEVATGAIVDTAATLAASGAATAATTATMTGADALVGTGMEGLTVGSAAAGDMTGAASVAGADAG